jgi:pimeloyl-ACP methyl ester carboxylesterase
VSAAAIVVAALLATAPDTGYVAGPDGVRLYYERIGSGPKTLIVPGRLFLSQDLQPLARHHTVILYDMRNRGRSSSVSDGALLTIQKDVEDLEAVRRHFKVEKFVPVGYSYLGFMVVLYAMAHEDRVERLVQIGPVPRKFGTEYPASLEHHDSLPLVDSATAVRLDSLGKTEWAKNHQQELCEEQRRAYSSPGSWTPAACRTNGLRAFPVTSSITSEPSRSSTCRARRLPECASRSSPFTEPGIGTLPTRPGASGR